MTADDRNDRRSLRTTAMDDPDDDQVPEGQVPEGRAHQAGPPDRSVSVLTRRDWLRSAASGALALGVGVGTTQPAAGQSTTITENQQTTHDGYFVSFWTDTEGSVSMTLESGGSYSVEWENSNNFVVGKGWETGAARTVEYTASEYEPGSNSYLCLYGWTTDPLVEYYVIEDHGPYRPEHDFAGTVESDGGTYDIYESLREEQPSIEGTATFPQYWSIRRDTRTSGTITVENHFDAWESNDMPLGDHDYQILATEGYQSSGHSSVTVAEADGADDDDDSDDDSDDGDDDQTCGETDAAETATVDGRTVCDLNGDGDFRDVDASGDVTSQDLSEFFANQHRDPWDSRDDLFDYNDDGNVGQPDVVDLFQYL